MYKYKNKLTVKKGVKRYVARRSRIVRNNTDVDGAMSGSTGDYAGMSNDKAGENPARRKPKVSWGR